MDIEFFYEKLAKVRRFSYGVVVVTTLLLGGTAYNHNDIDDNERAIQTLMVQVEKNQNKLSELSESKPVYVKAELSESIQPCMCVRIGSAIKSADKDNAIFHCALFPTCNEKERLACESILTNKPEAVECKSPSDW